MGVGSGVYMYDVVVKRSRSLSHLLMSSCIFTVLLQAKYPEGYTAVLLNGNHAIRTDDSMHHSATGVSRGCAISSMNMTFVF